MSEALVKRALKKYLDSIGAYYFMPVQMGLGSTTLDFLVCYKGFFFGIETKRPGLIEPTGRQAQTMDKIEGAGGTTWVENSLELEFTRGMLGAVRSTQPFFR